MVQFNSRVFFKDQLLRNSDDKIFYRHYEFHQDNQILRINNLKMTEDSGVYSCIAHNLVNTISSSARLTVNKASIGILF